MTKLESELTRHLAPVRAPAGLWREIQGEIRNDRAPVRRPIGWVVWPTVAGALLLLWQVAGTPQRPPVIRAAGGCGACHVHGL
ncbi:MAG: hypothetical protein ABJC09_14250 [Terriglobia bacterium]